MAMSDGASSGDGFSTRSTTRPPSSFNMPYLEIFSLGTRSQPTTPQPPFAADSSTVAGKKRKLTGLCIIGWIGFFAALFWYSAGMHTLYVALPFVFTAVPLTFLTDITVSFVRMKEPLENRHADRMNNRFPLAALMTALFMGFALAGEAVNVILGKELAAGDYLLMAGGLMVFAAGVLSFMERKNVEIEKDSAE